MGRSKKLPARNANQASISDFFRPVAQTQSVSNTNDSQEIDRSQQNNDQRRSDEDEKYRPADSAGPSSERYLHDSAPSSLPLDLRCMPEIQVASSSVESNQPIGASQSGTTTDNQQNMPHETACSEDIYVYDYREGTTKEDVIRELQLFCKGIENERCSIIEQYRIAAFKINVPTKFKEAVLNKNNWPESVCVREWSNPIHIMGTPKANPGQPLRQKSDDHKTNKQTKTDNNFIINMFYQNVNGLRTKKEEFKSNVMKCCHDVIVVTETNFKSSVNKAKEWFPPEYTVLQQDGVDKPGYHGVAIAARQELSMHRVRDVEGLTEDQQLLITILEKDNIKLLLCAVYIPSRYKGYNDLLVCIQNAVKKYGQRDVFIIGDFNLYTNPYIGNQYFNFTKKCKVKNFNYVLNEFGRILDLVLTNVDPDRVRITDTVEALVPQDKKHTPFKVTLWSE